MSPCAWMWSPWRQANRMKPQRQAVHGLANSAGELLWRGSLLKELIVIASLEEIDPLFTHQIYEPVLLGDSARPSAWAQILQGFGFSNALEWVAYHGFDKRYDPERDFSILLDPVLQIFNELGLKDSIPSLGRQGPPPPLAPPRSGLRPRP